MCPRKPLVQWACTGLFTAAMFVPLHAGEGALWFPRLRRAAAVQREVEAAAVPTDEAFQPVRHSTPAPAPAVVAEPPSPPAVSNTVPTPASGTPDSTAPSQPTRPASTADAGRIRYDAEPLFADDGATTGEARPFPAAGATTAVIVRVSALSAEPVLSPPADSDAAAAAPTHAADPFAAPQPAATTELAPVPMSPVTSPAGFTVDYFEQLALTNHPTLAQLSATISKANALRCQVQTYPNPTIGYSAQQLADRGTDQHIAFVQQQIVLGNKLELNANVLGHASGVQGWELEAQRCRVITDVRLRYYAALVAQERVRLTHRLVHLAETGVADAEKRQALVDDRELLLTEIQLQEIEILREQAVVAFRTAWQGLAAASGTPALAPPNVTHDDNWAPLTGSLLPGTLYRDWDAIYQWLLSCSPELHAARKRVDQARANLARQQAQPIPNLDVNLGAGFDNATDSQMINLQVGAPLPLFNKNRGNISAAYADYCRAAKDVERLELLLKSRLADVAQEFDSAVVAVTKYNDAILPKARKNLELTELYVRQAGDVEDFIPLIIARRTLFDTELQSVQAQGALAQAAAKLDGFLLSGGLEATVDLTLDDGLRGQTLDGQ